MVSDAGGAISKAYNLATLSSADDKINPADHVKKSLAIVLGLKK